MRTGKFVASGLVLLVTLGGAGFTGAVPAEAGPVHGHVLTVDQSSFWVTGREVHREIPRPSVRQLYRYNVLTMGNHRGGNGWRRLTSAEIDVAAEGADSPHPWGRSVIRTVGGVTFIDCPDWYVQTS